MVLSDRRPDQLVLPDDPAFVPDNVFPILDLDLSNLEITQPSSSKLGSSLVSGGSKQAAISSEGGRRGAAGFEGRSTSEDVGGMGGFDVPQSLASSAFRPREPMLPGDEPGFLSEVGFAFDQDGNIIETGGEAGVTAAEGDQRVPRTEGDLALSQQLGRGLQALRNHQEEVSVIGQIRGHVC